MSKNVFDLSTMRIEDAEDHPVPGVKELSVPIDPVVAFDATVKMMLEIVSKIVVAQTICQSVNTELSVLNSDKNKSAVLFNVKFQFVVTYL